MSAVITTAYEAPALDAVRQLFREYAESLNFDLCFQGFDRELAELPGEYAPPTGRLLLARAGDREPGCIALRALSPDICEMKRLYVRSEFRGQKIVLLLAQRLIAEARVCGYTHMRLNTVPAMQTAIGLYRSLGLVTIPPYRHNPVPGALFFELNLR
ncbi:MAG: GNAT family N-acetyltransferase [Candidatus Zixiibacteriota bacterium]